MLKEARFEQVYIVCGYTDMRRSIDGLAGIVKQNFGLEPCSGSLFLFCGKRRDRMKALLWEGDGFLLLYKRLDNGMFLFRLRHLFPFPLSFHRKLSPSQNYHGIYGSFPPGRLEYPSAFVRT